MEKHIYFVRHGESETNADGLYRGASAHLTEKGRAQAEEVAKRIERIGVDALIASPQVRTKETADAIAKRIGLPIEENDLFIERGRPTVMHGRRHEEPEISAICREIFERYASETHRHSDEENFEDLKARLGKALAFLAAYPVERICVVTHGVFLGLLMGRVLAGAAFRGEDAQRALRTFMMGNTGITHFAYSAEPPYRHPMGTTLNEWRLINWNDQAHLG
ncbi:MAG: histidine phosphatase family protein [Patescibacteria group bacterium]|nr:phosphoglycerate mutase family protein [Patescibacteria group bacterium]MDE1965891.1 histidine phosphatase family protein [Patescibacteria group bacterium]